jgi:DnaJ-class molecular chaperone
VEYKDYYAVLGVPKTATAKEIKAAYRRLARKYHPDVNKGEAKAEARFKEINEANEVLSDPDKRRRYDQLGANWSQFRGVPGGGAGWPGGGRVRVNVGGFGDQGVGDFSDFFNTFFGGGGGFTDLDEMLRGARSSQRTRGEDLEYEVELSLEEVLKGTTRTANVGGAGAPRRVEVKIPAGIRDGARVRAAGEGGGAAGGTRGDLYMRVKVRPHAIFVRDGDDLRASFVVPLTTAVLGGEAQVPTLEGATGIRIPAGTPVGRVFRLRGRGLPALEPGGGRGDLLVQLNVALPEDLSGREKELFEELRRLGR